MEGDKSLKQSHATLGEPLGLDIRSPKRFLFVEDKDKSIDGCSLL